MSLVLIVQRGRVRILVITEEESEMKEIRVLLTDFSSESEK